jgi:hypothetical protein
MSEVSKLHRKKRNCKNTKSNTYLDRDLSIVEVDDNDIAELLGVCSVRIVIGGGILFEHLQSSAFDFYRKLSQ